MFIRGLPEFDENKHMFCTMLNELPPPPPGKTGWPWAEESSQLPDTMPDGSPWPKISIVTPSLNQGQFIEETIRSVLLQGYPNLEYIIIDGGSTDGTIKIIKKYEKWLTYWVSEKDHGQAHAINKGWDLSTGSLLGWLNSDDTLLSGALKQLGKAHSHHPDSLIVGEVINYYSNIDKTEVVKQCGLTWRNFAGDWCPRFSWHQPGIYFPRGPLKEVGPLDESLNFEFDYDLMIRVLKRVGPFYLKKPIVKFLIHPEAKTQRQPVCMKEELRIISRRYAHLIPRAQAFWAIHDGIESVTRGHLGEGLTRIIRGIRTHPIGALIDLQRGFLKVLHKVINK
jgi:glycosyltransferase involved in cell wall biosynthesis